MSDQPVVPSTEERIARLKDGTVNLRGRVMVIRNPYGERMVRVISRVRRDGLWLCEDDDTGERFTCEESAFLVWVW